MWSQAQVTQTLQFHYFKSSHSFRYPIEPQIISQTHTHTHARSLYNFGVKKVKKPFMGSVSVDSNNRTEQEGVDGEENVLQKHVTFFDRDKDGIIYPWETFEGFRAIGCGYLLSSVGAIFINAGLSGKTRPGKFPSLLFPIEVSNIQKGKHGSDSGVYDSEGRFVPSKFEEIFSKHACTNANTLTGDELMGLLKANRAPKDYGGWLLSYTEWKILYVLCKDKKGLLHRDTIRAVYDGSLFEHMAKEKAEAGKRK